MNTKLKPIIRIANKNDIQIMLKNKKKEKNAFKICEQLIARQSLKMNLIHVECTFDTIIFYFTSEKRIDFRKLVKNLAAAFHTRIEFRQIGVRDKAKILGGCGICGREFCCKTYINSFNPMSVKIVKKHGISLNSNKVLGNCGRLMCCLQN